MSLQQNTSDLRKILNSVKKLPSAGGEEQDTLKTLLDAKQTTQYLFNDYNGTSVDGLIQYSSTSNVTTTNRMFYNCKNLTSVPLFDTSKVTDMNNMFYRCYKLTSVPLFDTSNVSIMNSMFYDCKDLTSIPQLNMSKVYNTGSMFYNCANLASASVDMRAVETASSMFYNCTNLKSVKLTGVSAILNATYNLFNGCTSLELIDFRGATGRPSLSSTNAFTGVPSTCKVLIPDALYDRWVNATNWSAINVVYVKESEYTEE